MSEVVKFTCQQLPAQVGGFTGFDELNEYRRKLIKLGMIGVDRNGVGFGNLSIRDGTSAGFYITGSATARIPELLPSNYARVIAYDFARNWLQYEGSTVASSESLTHAAVYEFDRAVCAVIHGHDMKLWATLLKEGLATPKQVEYGTPEMAYAVPDLLLTTKENIFAMAGHEGGVIAFGKNLHEAFRVLERGANRK